MINLPSLFHSRVRALSIVLLAAVGLSACEQSANVNTNAASDSATSAVAEGHILVSSVAEYQNIAKNLKAGDTVVLTNGVWQDFEILFAGEGSKEQPIRLMAQTEGSVILSGQSNLRLQGRYLEVSGLVFKDGYSPTGTVISFRGPTSRKNTDPNAYHSRVTRTVIDSFSNTDKFNSDTWVALFGQHNRFDHNHLEGKSNAGVTMAVRLGDENSQENYHQIDHNYFGPRPILGSNGGETLRIGTSKYSLSNSYTKVVNNYFDRANGEVEIISNKSGSNEFIGNVFYESRGTLTLRHGNNNLVEGNVFLGNGQDHTGGIRVINANQTIRNNYMAGLTGIRFGGGFVVLNGVPNSRINRYHQVDGAKIENNTIVNVNNINLAAGSDAERTAVPINSTFKNNLVVNETQSPFKLFDDVSGIVFGGNWTNQPVPAAIESGFERKPLDMQLNDSGLRINAAAMDAKVGAMITHLPVNKQDVGVSWYPKAQQEVAFNSGEVVSVDSSDALIAAVNNATPGARIELQSGTYDLSKQLQVNTVITIAGAANSDVVLYPLRSLMVEIEDGGSLSLENIDINGEKAPDSAGNVLIRNTRLPSLLNYRLAMQDVNISNLNVNHSAHVFDAGYRSLADIISIKNSTFSDITGDILRLNKEQDDLGIYNVEYVAIENSGFENIQGNIANVYRGGTDESTFGPHFLFTNNTVTQVGFGKRNKAKASIYLHGVQDTDLIDNRFVQSAPIVIEHTVGEPQTLIQGNQFVGVELPLVTEVFTQGESTAILMNNNVEDSL
jgi:poly(beta-D-mannuronate) lyase